jgi:hypothetical protein
MARRWSAQEGVMRGKRIMAVASLLTLAACHGGEPGGNEMGSPGKRADAANLSSPAGAAAMADWSSLDALVGRYPHENHVIDRSVITPALRALLGDKMAVLETNLEVAAPLQREGAVLFLSGNKAHEGGSDAAYLLIDPALNALEVGLWEHGRLTTYKTRGSALAKPRDVQTMIANNEKPPGEGASGR